MAPTTHLTSNGSGVNCCVCRNLDYKCSLPGADGDDFVGRAFEFANFSRRFSDFENSADQGCPVCWVLASIRGLWDDSIETAAELQIDLEADGDVKLSCWNYPDLHLYVPRDNTLSVPGEKALLFQSIQVKADISESAWSETAQRFARHCIQACVEDHDLCGLGESLLPMRVIEVGNIGDEKLRLCETQRDTPGLYTALSYCWGSDQQLKTTSANIEDMMSGRLRLSHLPQTLADAVHVTRSLGVPYLWIDALCIIQDDIEDWERESEQMATIYEKAYLVISASSSSSVTQGFLNHQRHKRAHRFEIHSTQGTQSSVAARKCPRSGIHDPPWISDNTDPLAQRAWAFQEQHMSTRCLIFSTDELQWVCKTKAACECDRTTRTTHNHQLLSVNCDDAQKGDEADSQLALLDMWHVAVDEYSCRKLTLPDDKLPALSGLASRFGARMGFRYVSGLWEENIIQDLTWSRPLGLAPLPIKSRAPSFSWASIDCGVHYGLATSNEWHWIPCSSASDLQVIVPGHNPFGKVTDAWITIRGPMVRGTIEGGLENPRFCSDDGKIDVYFTADCALTVFNYTTAGKGDKISVRRCRHLTPSEDSTREAPEDALNSNIALASVWLLQLGRFTHNRSQSAYDGDSFYFYLVLGKSAHDPQKYERIGCCDPRSKEPLDKQSERFTTKTITIV